MNLLALTSLVLTPVLAVPMAGRPAQLSTIDRDAIRIEIERVHANRGLVEIGPAITYIDERKTVVSTRLAATTTGRHFQLFPMVLCSKGIEATEQWTCGEKLNTHVEIEYGEQGECSSQTDVLPLARVDTSLARLREIGTFLRRITSQACGIYSIREKEPNRYEVGASPKQLNVTQGHTFLVDVHCDQAVPRRCEIELLRSSLWIA